MVHTRAVMIVGPKFIVLVRWDGRFGSSQFNQYADDLTQQTD